MSKFYFVVHANGNIADVTTEGNRLYQGMTGVAQYHFKMAEEHNPGNVLPGDTVLINFSRPDGQRATDRMRYNENTNEWVCTSNGWETDIDIPGDHAVLNVSFEARRYSTIQAQKYVRVFTSGLTPINIYPSTSYVPLGIPSPIVDSILERLTGLEGDVADLTEETSGLQSSKVDKTTTIAGIDLEDDITASELKTALNVLEKKETPGSFVYTHLGNIQAEVPYTTEADAETIVFRGIGATVKCGTATEDDDAVNFEQFKDVAIPNGTDPLISEATGTIDIKYLGSGVKRLAGQWNASTNTPPLPNPPTNEYWGNVYDVTVAGTQFGIQFNVGDQIVGYQSLNDNTFYWGKTDNTDLVTSVNGRTGAITLTSPDIKPITDTYF